MSTAHCKMIKPDTPQLTKCSQPDGARRERLLSASSLMLLVYFALPGVGKPFTRE